MISAVTAPTNGTANCTMRASSMSRAPATAQVPSHWPDLPSMRLNCHEPMWDHLLSRRINCLAASPAKDLPSRRLNCSLATSATNPYVVQCAGYHILRLASPLKHLAVALWIRAHYSLRPHLSEFPFHPHFRVLAYLEAFLLIVLGHL